MHLAPPNTTGFSDFDAPAGITWRYRVRAVNSVGESPFTYAEWRSVLHQWRFRHFGTVAATGSAADLAAPHGDGIANLLKYAFNPDPAGYDNRTQMFCKDRLLFGAFARGQPLGGEEDNSPCHR